MQPQTPGQPQQSPYPQQPQYPYPPAPEHGQPYPAQQYQPQPMQPQPQQQPEETPKKELQKTPQGMHPMVVLQPGEHIVCTIRRHPFGIISLYAAAVLGIAIAVILAFVLLPGLLNQAGANNSGTMEMVYSGLAIVVVGLILILGVATSVYWQNEWVVTTDSITQISQNSLFNRQVSQLSLDNLEDVTVNQDGILPHMFGFGTLKVESAGERSKFQFPYCPDPDKHAREILEVHEDFLEMRRNVQNSPPTYTHSG